ncbi:hypothetical protein D9M71_663460 [compost metagenome]
MVGVASGGPHAVNDHARCLFKHLGNIVQVLVFNLLAGDHADRLGCLACRQPQPGCGIDRAGGVAAGAFGGGTQGHAGDGGCRKLHGAILLSADQHEVLVARCLHLQATALQQFCQRLMQRVIAVQPFAVQACDCFMAETDDCPAGVGKLVECVSQ